VATARASAALCASLTWNFNSISCIGAGRIGAAVDGGRAAKIGATHFAAATMSIFARAPYKSEVTNFIDELKANKPTLEAEQRAGRALLWDRKLDRDALARWREARVAQRPYVYYEAEVR